MLCTPATTDAAVAPGGGKVPLIPGPPPLMVPLATGFADEDAAPAAATVDLLPPGGTRILLTAV